MLPRTKRSQPPPSLRRSRWRRRRPGRRPPRRPRSRSSPRAATSAAATSSSPRPATRPRTPTAPEILDRHGNVVWFHAIPPGQTAADFRAQTYRGQPVLTWWQGTGFGGLSTGTDYIYNDRYQQIATVNAGNGLSADGHEFLITPWNTALILAYTTATADLTSIGGPADQTVINGVVQEIDIRTGKVLFQWNSADHVPYSQSEQPLPASRQHPVGLVPHQRGPSRQRRQPADRRARHVDDLRGQPRTAADHLAARRQGEQLQAAGRPRADARRRRRDLRLAARPRGDRPRPLHVLRQRIGRLANTELRATSRAVTVRLDQRARVATLVASDDQPEGLAAPSQGNAQTTAEAACSSAGARCPTSPSSTARANLCSTRSSRPASTPTGRTCSRGTRERTGRCRRGPAEPGRNRESRPGHDYPLA